MRALALALAFVVLSAPAGGARSTPAQIAYVHGDKAELISVGSPITVTALLPRSGVPRWSGDGGLVSFGGYIVRGGVSLPTVELVWAPMGQRAAYVTRRGGVEIWNRSGRHTVTPDGWGAQGVAWSTDGRLALGRAVCRRACGRPTHTEIWTWRAGTLRKLLDTHGAPPHPVGWQHGRVLWWEWPNSNSLAADGVFLYANERRIAVVLMYRDYVVTCGAHLAIAAGGDRFSTHGKRILFDGRDVSRDRTRSWVSPSCTSSGKLVAAAGRNWEESHFGLEHRAIWQLLPAKRQLTHPPAGWTDEYPTVLRNGDVVFVRTRQIPFKRNGEWWTTTHGKLMLLRGSKPRELRALQFSGPDIGSDFLNYYGHYDWPSRLAYAP